MLRAVHLQDLAAGFMSGKLMLKLDAVHFMLTNHTQVLLPALLLPQLSNTHDHKPYPDLHSVGQPKCLQSLSLTWMPTTCPSASGIHSACCVACPAVGVSA